jgi:hypothetical protein
MRATGCIGAAAAAAVLTLAPGWALAGPPRADTASVAIRISVEPIAEIAFPAGRDFTLTVPDEGQIVQIDPLWLPFAVRGNAIATVTARPADFMQAPGNRWLGAASRDGSPDRLGYDVVVHFPVSAQSGGTLQTEAVFGFFGVPGGFATLPLHQPSGTPPISVDMVEFDRQSLGLIHLLSNPELTSNGSRAATGVYTGLIEVTVTAAER